MPVSNITNISSFICIGGNQETPMQNEKILGNSIPVDDNIEWMNKFNLINYQT